MSPVVVCFGVLDAAVIAQAAYAARDLRTGTAKDTKEVSPPSRPPGD